MSLTQAITGSATEFLTDYTEGWDSGSNAKFARMLFFWISMGNLWVAGLLWNLGVTIWVWNLLTHSTSILPLTFGAISAVFVVIWATFSYFTTLADLACDMEKK